MLQRYRDTKPSVSRLSAIFKKYRTALCFREAISRISVNKLSCVAPSCISYVIRTVSYKRTNARCALSLVSPVLCLTFLCLVSHILVSCVPQSCVLCLTFLCLVSHNLLLLLRRQINSVYTLWQKSPQHPRLEKYRHPRFKKQKVPKVTHQTKPLSVGGHW